MLYVMLTGDYDFAVNLALINKGKLKQLVKAFPGAHGLLPSEKHVREAIPDTLYGAPLIEQGWDLNGNGVNNEAYDYPAYKTWMNASVPESLPATTNELFHSQPGQDNWGGDNSGVEYFHIIGGAEDTVANVKAREYCLYIGSLCIGVRFYDVRTIDFAGDGTVPHLSGYGSDGGAGAGLVQHFNDFSYGHGRLPSESEVQQCIIGILNSGACGVPAASAHTEDEAQQVSAIERYEILIIGSGSAVVTDAAGNMSGWVDDFAMLDNIPGVHYYDTGGEAVRITTPTTEPLTVTFKSGDTPLFVEVLKASNDTVVEAVRYADLVVAPNSSLFLSLPLSNTAPLSLDVSGDGLPDTLVSETPMRATGSLAADTLPPTVTLSITPDRVVTVMAEDPAGVKAAYYSFDGSNFAPYSAPVQAPISATMAYAFADDNLANRSAVTSQSITPDQAASITSTPATAAVVGQPYSYDVEANGLPAPTFSLLSQPTGMTIDAASGLIQWTPNATGGFTVTVQAANGVNPPAQQTFVIHVVAAPQAPSITSTPVTTAVVGQPYSYDVEASGLPAPGFSLLTQPAGMTIDASSGLIQWTPNATGDFTVTVQAANGVNPSAQQTFVIHVSATPQAPAITSTPGTAAVVGVSYSYDMEASGLPAPSFSLLTQPAGMTIDAASGLIQWTPNATGDFTVVVQAANGVNPPAQQTFVIHVSAAPQAGGASIFLPIVTR